jgi:hypothetical protein
MTSHGTCARPDLAELLGPYLLGACAQEEAGVVREHILTCRSCREAFAAWGPARDGLLMDVEPAAPPEALRSRVMGQVRADAALFAAARERAQPEPQRTPRRSLGSVLRGLGGRLGAPRPAWALGIAAVAAVVITLGAEGTLGMGGTDRETVYAARVDGVTAPGAHASLAVHEGDARLQVSGLPAAGSGRMYQVWLRTGTAPARPAGVHFSVDARGAGGVALPSLPHTGEQVLVTSERGGDAAVPTRSPIVRVSV